MTVTIVDIGASNGVYSLKWAKKYPKGTVFAIEPLPASFNELKKRSRGIKNIECFQMAIDSENGHKKFHISKYHNSSSLLPFVEENTHKWKAPPNALGRQMFQYEDIIKVRTQRLDSFLTQHNIKTVDFLKIDTQGNDFNVIKSLGNRIEDIKEVVLEVQIIPYELYKGAPTKKEVVDYMTNHGFNIHRVQKWSQNQEENIWFINSKFSNFLHLN